MFQPLIIVHHQETHALTLLIPLFPYEHAPNTRHQGTKQDPPHNNQTRKISTITKNLLGKKETDEKTREPLFHRNQQDPELHNKI
jgi:hypothetical protein